MGKRWLTSIKAAIAIALFASVLAGCGTNAVSESYPLESVTKDGKQLSRVYRAENKTVPEVATELADQRTPKEMSKEDDDHMFLVYSDEWYHLQKDPEKPEDTLIEVDNQEFVKENYSPSFLEGYVLASLIGNLFDSARNYTGSYRGYGERDIYKPKTEYHTPTAQERKSNPPLTVEGSGSIIKRSDKVKKNTVGSGGSIFSKGSSTSDSSTGKIIKDSDSQNVKPKKSTITKPRNNSPPKTRVGGTGKLFKRR